MPNKFTSKNTKLQLSISAVYTDVVSLDSINAPAAKVQTIDTTSLDSAVGMEHKPTGYVDGGVCSASGFFDPLAVTHQALTDTITAPAVSLWKVIWTDGSTTAWPFSGVLDEFSPTAKVGDFLRFNLSITLDGMVTYPT